MMARRRVSKEQSATGGSNKRAIGKGSNVEMSWMSPTFPDGLTIMRTG